MEIGGLSDCDYCWHAVGGRDGGGSTGGGWRGCLGRSLDGVQGRSPDAAGAPGLSRNELKMFHEQIVSRNEAWFMKIKNSTLRYECDETFSDECEFAARAEGEWCNHTCQKNVFSHEYRTKFYITRCENADFRTRSVCKTAFTHSEWYKQIFSLKYTMRISSANEEHFFHFATRWTVCTLARIVAGISPATIRCRWFCPPLRLIPVWSSKCHFTISKLFKHWTSWSSIPYAMFHRSVLQGTRGEATVVAVHFSNEERAYLCRCTSFPFYDAFCDCFLWLHSTDAQ